MIKKSIKGYRLLERRGESPIAEVFKAEDLSQTAKQIVALKVLKPEFSGDQNLVNRFHKANKRLSSISYNESFVKVLETTGNSKQGPVYSVMEYIEALNLNEHLSYLYIEKRNEFCKAILLEICKVIRDAHQLSITHKGLHAGDIFVYKGEDGRIKIKIGDFGANTFALCENIETIRAQNNFFSFAAPEQFNKSEPVGKWSDIYNITAVLHWVLTGRKYFEGNSMLLTKENHSYLDRFQLTPLDSLLHPAYSERVNSVNELQIIFNQYLRDFNYAKPAKPVFYFKIEPTVVRFNSKNVGTDQMVKIRLWKDISFGKKKLSLEIPNNPSVDWIHKISTENLDDIGGFKNPSIIKVVCSPSIHKEIKTSKLEIVELNLFLHKDQDSTVDLINEKEISINIIAGFSVESHDDILKQEIDDGIEDAPLESKDRNLKRKISIIAGAVITVLCLGVKQK